MRRYLRFQIILLISAVLIGCAADPPPRTIHIVPLGDSITQAGHHGRNEYGFRYPLYYMLVEAHVDFDFVGSTTRGLDSDFTWPDREGVPFDLHHEGHYGVSTDWTRDHLADFMKKWASPPDMVIINLCGNDMGRDKDIDRDVVQPFREMIAMLRDKNPHVVILIGDLQWNGGRAKAINSALDKLATELSTDDSPIATVPLYKGWNSWPPGGPDSDTFDGAHPNEKGQQKMAASWFNAMKPYLEKMGWKAPATEPTSAPSGV